MISTDQLLKTNQPPNEQETYWFQTPKQPGDPETYTPIQQRIYVGLMKLKQLQQLNPNNNEESRKKVLDHFVLTDTTLNPFEKQHI